MLLYRVDHEEEMEDYQECLEKTSLDCYNNGTAAIQTLVQWWDFCYENANHDDNKYNEISDV